VARVAAASSEHLDADPREREAVALLERLAAVTRPLALGEECG
jgi:hypothetical protein